MHLIRLRFEEEKEDEYGAWPRPNRGMTSSLGSLSSELSFTVSFFAGSELLAIGNALSVPEDQLTFALILSSVLLSGLPFAVSKLTDTSEAGSALNGQFVGLVSFLSRLLTIVTRIAGSVLVNVLASQSRVADMSQSIRIVTLLSVSSFFLFLEALVGTE
jgi:hypothetical protein